MTRNLEFSIGEYYHLYNRGTEKRNVFMDQKDWWRFTSLLYICNDPLAERTKNLYRMEDAADAFKDTHKEQRVAIGAYCLMPNHFHILAKEIRPDGISNFMHRVSTAYTMYFNKKYERNGVLFQGRFKASQANRDEYLKYLYAYIHLNPVKLIEPKWKENGIKDRERALAFLRKYRYSSYIDFAGEPRAVGKILTPSVFPEYFTKGSKDFENLISFWLSFREEEGEKAVQGST